MGFAGVQHHEQEICTLADSNDLPPPPCDSMELSKMAIDTFSSRLVQQQAICFLSTALPRKVWPGSIVTQKQSAS